MPDASPSLVERVFHLLVRRARWLGHVPVLPWFMDTLAHAAVAVTDRTRYRAMHSLIKTVTAWPEITDSLHRFGGMEFRVKGREIGHLHGCGLLDVRVGRDRARELIAAGHAEPHHVFGDSAWVSIWVRREEDVPGAVEVLRAGLDGIRHDSTAVSSA